MYTPCHPNHFILFLFTTSPFGIKETQQSTYQVARWEVCVGIGEDLSTVMIFKKLVRQMMKLVRQRYSSFLNRMQQGCGFQKNVDSRLRIIGTNRKSRRLFSRHNVLSSWIVKRTIVRKPFCSLSVRLATNAQFSESSSSAVPERLLSSPEEHSNTVMMKKPEWLDWLIQQTKCLLTIPMSLPRIGICIRLTSTKEQKNVDSRSQII
ncbi:hypothetical protein CAEBREN_21334 [Caenorhabditis brenneri]|uniref:Uncharacterized protein n=1 Tax=Caenorhabditis brenneri TaxID=135651 RepID=G0NW73_CAEBE|nr:hypothetical protein CAEBREN_21334 [Caenorhabditis brenneri]